MLNQNQFALTTVKGTLVFGRNVITCEFYSATQTDTISAGAMIKIVSTSLGAAPKVSVGADDTAEFIGVVLTNPLKESYVVGDKMEVAFDNCVVMMEAPGALTAGIKLMFEPSTNKIAAQTTGKKVIGLLMQDAGADGDLVPVYVKPVVVPA
jgi:hypothetical protein